MFECFLDFVIHGVLLADFESESGNDTVEDIVTERFGGIDITGCWWVIVVESDDTQRSSTCL